MNAPPWLAAAAIILLGSTGPRTEAARTPYETCIAAANTPGPAGYATEVCEPLAPGWVEPARCG